MGVIALWGVLLLGGLAGIGHDAYKKFSKINVENSAPTPAAVPNTSKSNPSPSSKEIAKEVAKLIPQPPPRNINHVQVQDGVVVSDSTKSKKQTANGNNNTQIGGITQGAGSIAQIGGQGNTATIINPKEPPPSIDSWNQAEINPNSQGNPGIKLTIRVAHGVEHMRIAARCSSSCILDRAQQSGGAFLSYGTLNPSYDFNVGIEVDSPKLQPDYPVDLYIYSKTRDPISVQDVIAFIRRQ